ncbi:unnamed protein product [Cochlearia groenlandica]
MNFASTWLDRLRLNRGHSSADDYDSSGKPLTIDDFLRRDHRTGDIVSDSTPIRSDLDLSKTKSDPEPNEIQSYGFFRAAVISGDNHRRKQSNPKHFSSETNEDEDPLLATEAAEISEETDFSYDDPPILSGVHVVNTSSLSSKSAAAAAAEISVTRRTESDSAGDNGDEETDSADHEVATSSRISKSAAATAEISKRRRIAAESDGEDDGEEEEKDLTGFTKSEVTVIDTSFEIWRSQKLVFRKGNVWRVKDTSRVFSSKKKTKKKKKKRNGDVDDGEVSKLVKARR